MQATSKYRYLYFLFVISGFAGLIYESIWSHYLKLFLGHAAYSQALVLAIFMGGMALGAWLAGKILYRKINLLFAYAAVELLIGFLGMVFHNTFLVVLDISFNHVIPELANPAVVMTYKWLTGAILILPQSVLLGATFPLMTNGLLRIHPDLPGRSIALLYFGNSIGAAIGVLVSGFYLIAKTGIPGTILTAGIINILIAIAVYMIAKGQVLSIPVPVRREGKNIPYLILAASFLTGTASFIYELVWIRMLSMVLGASTHSFELMLSAFITGLAFGGLWIHRRIDRLKDPVQFGGYVQIIMALLAVSTLLLYNQTFEFMGYLIKALGKTDAGYLLFNLGSHFIALLIMLPVTFLAGMTLPLFTLILLKHSYGEKSISHIYVSNMFGAITGVTFTIFAGFPFLGLKGSLLTGGIVDLLLGFVLLLYAGPVQRRFLSTVLPALAIFLVLAIYSGLDPKRMASSVFRTGNTIQAEGTTIPFHRDGKTATVTVVRYPNSYQSLLTNGKADASVFMVKKQRTENSPDEITQVLLGAIPMAIRPDSRFVANIGMGSGVTSHIVLSWPSVERLDTVEIESEIVDAAQYFRPYNEKIFTDRRSSIHIEDAKTFFSVNKQKYDVIISEPSNPWVSGVSSLYTQEFYQQISRSLTHDGYLVQWLHLYEMNLDLFLSVMKAMSLHFEDFRIYAANDADLVIMARRHGAVEELNQVIFAVAEMNNALSMVNINNINDIKIRFIANRRLIEPLLSRGKLVSNSDYFPLLDLYAPKARYKGELVKNFIDLRISSVPVLQYLIHLKNLEGTDIDPHGQYSISKLAVRAHAMYNQITQKDYQDDLYLENDAVNIQYLLGAADHCTEFHLITHWLDALFVFIQATLPYLIPAEMDAALTRITPRCNNVLTEDQQHWLALLTALNVSDPEQIIFNSQKLLEHTESTPREMRRFLVMATLLGLAMAGRTEEFRDTFSQHLPSLVKQGVVPFAAEILHHHVLINNQD
jgi:spermidine synthase